MNKDLIIKCPDCQKEGNRSRVYCLEASKFLGPDDEFWDEDGRYHEHLYKYLDVSVTEYECSNMHRWTMDHAQSTGPCWCGWPENVEEKSCNS